MTTKDVKRPNNVSATVTWQTAKIEGSPRIVAGGLRAVASELRRLADDVEHEAEKLESLDA